MSELQLHGSRIIIEPGLLDSCGARVREALPGRRLAIVSDTNVAPIYAARVAAACGGATLFTIPAGEGSKSREQWARLTDALLDAGFGRDSAILALGGGVVGDLAGFVAATYMRGIPFVQMPTSLLAMIDAAIGGKTGVDTAAGKNLVGAFHHPARVLVDPLALATLPREQLRNGLAEAIKHAVISSADEFGALDRDITALTRDAGPDSETATWLVQRHVVFKMAVVAQDERETGARKLLNFGHTIGHAIESLSGFALLHGECVAIGMVVEARIAARMGLADASVADAIVRLLDRAGLPSAVPTSMRAAAILDATRSDKKARGGIVEYALPSAIGTMAGADRGFAIPVADALVMQVLEASRAAS